MHGASSPWLQQIRGKWIANGRSQADPDGRIYDPYVDGPSTPLFYFGYGLSYGTFKYSDPMAKMTGNREQPVEVNEHNLLNMSLIHSSVPELTACYMCCL